MSRSIIITVDQYERIDERMNGSHERIDMTVTRTDGWLDVHSLLYHFRVFVRLSVGKMSTRGERVRSSMRGRARRLFGSETTRICHFIAAANQRPGNEKKDFGFREGFKGVRVDFVFLFL